MSTTEQAVQPDLSDPLTWRRLVTTRLAPHNALAMALYAMHAGDVGTATAWLGDAVEQARENVRASQFELPEPQRRQESGW